MQIIIGGDVVPTASNRDAFSAGDAVTLLGEELTRLLKAADYRIVNLEAPLADRKAPIKKCGPALSAPESSAEGLRAMGIDLVTLANNHILDQGSQGMASTVRALESRGIAWLGVGENAREAAKPYILSREGKRVGIYACAESEFSIATEDTPGANPFDPLWSLDHIRQLKESCDYVIVLYHGGKERYRYPSPGLRKVCRRIADKGADLVLCQHSHCVGCQEAWNGSTIVYGQGNFLFDRHTQEVYQTGILVRLKLFEGPAEIDYIPVARVAPHVRMAGEGNGILEGFRERSRRILEPGFVEAEFTRFARENVIEYYGRSLGRRRYLLYRLANLLFRDRLRYKCYTEKDALALINTLECEPHRELYLAALGSQLRENAPE